MQEIENNQFRKEKQGKFISHVALVSEQDYHDVCAEVQKLIENFNAKVAAAAGVTQPLLYSYFKNKMDLLYECCLHAGSIGRTKIYGFMDPSDSERENIHQYLLGKLTWFKSDPVHAHIILSMYYFAGTDERIRKIFDFSQNAATEKILELLEKGKKAGEWNGQRLKDKAQSIHSLLVGEAYKTFYPTQQASPESRASALRKDCLKLLTDR